MTGETRRFKWPLHTQISIIFTMLILLVGATLALFSHNQMSTMILESTDELFSEISEAIVARFRGEYSPLSKSVKLLSLARIARATNLEERLTELPILAEGLNEQPNVTSIQLGYGNGDYLVMRSALTSHVREAFAVPDQYDYIVDHFTPNPQGEVNRQRLFLDAQLRVAKTSDLGVSHYDPRTRPWYENTRDSLDSQTTLPYYFYFTKQLGITLSRRAPDSDTVVAADITLDSLSETLAENIISASAISILYNDAGDLYAYSDSSTDSIFHNASTHKALKISNLKGPIINQIKASTPNKGVATSFEIDGKNWLGNINTITMANDLELKLLVAAPEHELFARVISFRHTSMLITLAVIIAALPIAGLLAKQISRPLQKLAEESRAISRFEFDQPISTNSRIQEVLQLSQSMDVMKTTISNFLKLITSLSGESDLNRLLDRMTEETMKASGADGAVIFLVANDETELVAASPIFAQGQKIREGSLSSLPLVNPAPDGQLVQHYLNREVGAIAFKKQYQQSNHLRPLFEALETEDLTVVALPLQNRKNEGLGILCLVYTAESQSQESAANKQRLGFSRALSGFAAVSIESRQLIYMQKALLQSFIQLLASAIDAKSPYTGGHCQRVPEITQMLATAACESTDARFADFDLNEEEWEELYIAAWLHDCGKVTIPEYVVDKSTKLETIYDRIHEVRMRFEVLKRDAIIEQWQAISKGADPDAAQLKCDAALLQLDEDFAFVGECNIGGEFMSDQRIERLEQIGKLTWQRTLNDRTGVSWEELRRKERTPPQQLPVVETLLADRPDHIITRAASDHIPDDNPLGFNVDTPTYKYNRGELYNLSIRKGTLTTEERYVINSHMVQTITMLNQLPYPKHLQNVPAIAGGHHETMDGKGYPKRLCKDDMSLTARMMAIADIFEALTAADRPYKKPKKLSETIRIMGFMVADKHIDPDLFDLFLTSGVYLQYATRFLASEQIDEVNIDRYLSETAKQQQARQAVS